MSERSKPQTTESTKRTIMDRIGLTIARLAAAIWIGAAFLFVVTSVTEQVQPNFDVATKDRLALIRFPWFYGTGFTLLIACGLATAFAAIATRTRTIVLSLILAALVLMIVDFLFVYRPLRETLLESASVRGAAFDRLHAWSEGINSVGFLLAAAAAILLCAARDRSKNER